MSAKISRKYRKRISYIPTFLSITLVLFLSGLFGLFLLHTNALKEVARENVQLNIYFTDEIAEADIHNIEKNLRKEHYVKDVDYISKSEGLKKWQEDMGESPEQLLGFNPFPNSIIVHFRPQFVNIDSLDRVKLQIQRNRGIREVTYDTLVVQNIDKNVRIVGIILIGLALLMALVSIALINNTIRLTMYAKRFIIKSMQLVGATQGFIRRPFIINGLLLGFFSSIAACLLLSGCLYLLLHKFPELVMLQDNFEIALLFGGLIVIGILISILSSFFAINKYMKLKLDDLF